VLHDLSLAEMHYERLCKNGSETIFLDEVEALHGASVRAVALDIMSDPQRRGWMDLLMVDRLVRSSRGVIVHSAWARTLLTLRALDTPIFHVMQPAPVLESSPMRRDALHQGDDPPTHGLVVGVVGGLARRKRTHVAIEAFARLHAWRPDARMVVAGREEDRDYLDELHALVEEKALGSALRFQGELGSIEEVSRLLQSVDLIVNLRWPTSGETSAVMMRAFAAGKVVVTSDAPQFREYPDEFCWRAPVDVSDADEQAAVTALLEHAAADRAGLARRGHEARRFMQEKAAWPRIAARYLEIGLAVQTRVPLAEAPASAVEKDEGRAETARSSALLAQWEDVRRASERAPTAAGVVGRVVHYGPLAALARLCRRVCLLGQLTTAQLALNRQVLDENERLRNEIRQLQVERLVALESRPSMAPPGVAVEQGSPDCSPAGLIQAAVSARGSTTRGYVAHASTDTDH